MSDADRAVARISKIYAASNEAGAEATYDGWAADYDADTAALGFRLPGLAAAYLSRYLPRGAGPILDAGCGTGQVGGQLQGLGYHGLHGLDLSQGMLDIAARTGVYEDLRREALGDVLSYGDDSFAASLVVGSLGVGHAPPDCLREIVRVTRPGGIVVFNVVAETQAAQGFPALIEAMTADGLWSELDRSPPWDVYQSPAECLEVVVMAFQVGDTQPDG